MTVNTKKTEVIFFGNKSRLKKLDNKTVKYLGTPLEHKKEAKYLGVIFDEKMQWSSQISNITKKVNFKLGKIKSVASFLTSHTKKLLVNAYSCRISITAPRLGQVLHLFGYVKLTKR